MRAYVLLIAALSVAAPAAAQTLMGTADWSYGRAAYDGDTEPTVTSTFAQAYSAGYESTLWDPRFLRYSGTLTWQRMGLTQSGKRGASTQLGYRARGALFPARPFPITLEASRGTGTEAAGFPSSSPVRGGLEVLPSELMGNFDTRTSQMAITSQLFAKRLPRLDVNYQRANAAVSLGAAEAEQRDSALTANMTYEARRTRSALRYTRNRTDNLVTRLFSQRVSDLAYTLSADLSRRMRADVRAGYRDTFSLVDDGPRFVDLGRELYRLPTGRRSSLTYGTTSLAYQSARRLTSSAGVTVDRQDAAAGTATGLLASSENRYVLPGGLSLQAAGNYGRRSVSSPGQRIEVATRGVSAGANWRVPLRRAPVSVGYTALRGWHEDGSGRSGTTRGQEANLGASASLFKRFEVSGGLDRARARDDLLVFGNYSADRARATARVRLSRHLSFGGAWERSATTRGSGASLSRSRLRNSSASVEYQISASSRLIVNAGRLQSYPDGTADEEVFLGASYDTKLASGLYLTVTARREHVALERSRLVRDGVLASGRLEYRLTRFTFSLDYRVTNLTLDTGPRASDAVDYKANQLLFRISRRFALPL